MSIPIVRSWPKLQPKGRMYVDDVLPREYIEGYDFSVLRMYYHHGVIHLDWDIAVAPETLEAFRTQCNQAPERIRIAPYMLYKPSTGENAPVWAHRRNVVPFGIVYLPPWTLQEWKPQTDDGKLNDTTFSTWLRKEHPEVRPALTGFMPFVHLHY